MEKIAGDFLAGIIIIGTFFVLVRPGSQGPTLVNAVTSGLSGLLTAATGGQGWSGTLK